MMSNNYYDPYERNTDFTKESAQSPRFRSTDPQTAYRHSSCYSPYVRAASGPADPDPYRVSSGAQRSKKKKAKMSKGAVAAVLSVCVLLSGVAGFGGSYLFSQMNTASDTPSSIQINRASAASAAKTSADVTDKSTNEIVDEVADSVVEITVEIVQANPYYGEYTAQGAGSGVIISEDGYILTNNHVIDSASKITVTLRSGESYEARLVGTDPDVDIALLKIEADGLSAAIVGDSSTVEAGDKSVIIGNPLGTLGGSVTEGIISAADRAIEIDGKTMHLMQTDAAVNPGNSGGGMFNGQGELVGIVVAKSSDASSGGTIDNIGFVIPINNALDILDDLKDYGYVRGRASTGMAFSEGGNQLAQYLYGYSDGGVYIASIESGSNAEKAGFSVGDRVISVDGKEVTSVSDVSTILSEHAVGDTIRFELERSGRTGTIDLTLEEYAPVGSV